MLYLGARGCDHAPEKSMGTARNVPPRIIPWKGITIWLTLLLVEDLLFQLLFFEDIWTFRIEMARFLLAFSCVLLFITLFNVLLPVYATSKGNPHPFHSDRWRSAAIFTGRSFSFPLCFENNNNNSKGTPNSNAALQLWREIQSPSVHRSSLRRATSFKRCVSSTSILFPFLMIY